MQSKHKKYIYNIKQKIKLVLPASLLMATPIFFQSCEFFKTQASYSFTYEPGVTYCPSVYDLEQYKDAADYVTISINVVPNPNTANYTCAQMRNIATNLENAVMMSKGDFNVLLSGKIIVSKNGCGFDPCVYEAQSTPGMYNMDSVWLAMHNILITYEK